MPLAVCTRLRRPAVSTNRQTLPSSSTSESTGSTVVPATSCTTERTSPDTRLNRLDLPTLGLPTSATRRGPAPPAPKSSRGDSGSASSTASSRSPEPPPGRPPPRPGSPDPEPPQRGGVGDEPVVVDLRGREQDRPVR